ncbi:MAG: metallophosphoesterase [Verrucomicrobiota bacterium]
MAAPLKILVASDIHFAGPQERQRTGYESAVIKNWLIKTAARLQRRFIWLSNPLLHHGMLQRLVDAAGQPDFAIVNGDYSCDSAFIGVADDAVRESTRMCLDTLRARFAPNFAATIGDHELGKFSLFGGCGGLRLESYRRAVTELGLQPFWRVERGRFVLLGVTSTLVGLPVLESEALASERAEWWRLRKEHLAEIVAAFAALKPEQRVLLFCHDPSALPFLMELDAVRTKMSRVAHTLIGHLHTNQVLKLSRLLGGMPPIRFLGNTARRMSTALAEARKWKPFNVVLCPSLTGIELLKDGGFLTLEFSPDNADPVAIKFHPLPW